MRNVKAHKTKRSVTYGPFSAAPLIMPGTLVTIVQDSFPR